MLGGTDTENGIEASVWARVNVEEKLKSRPPVMMREIVLSPRLSFASPWNAITVSTEVPPFDRATDGGDWSLRVFVLDVDSPQAPAMATKAIAAASEASPRLVI